MQSGCIRKVKVYEGEVTTSTLQCQGNIILTIVREEGIPPCPPVSHNIEHVGRFTESSETFYYINIAGHILYCIGNLIIMSLRYWRLEGRLGRLVNYL